MPVKLSQVSKLDGIKSWSLPTLTTCPGAYTKDGSIVEVCGSCYARRGNYRFQAVKNVRKHNQEDWKRSDWVSEMLLALRNERYLRFFDSGDIYHPKLAEKLLEVVVGAPWCQFWLPTRSHKVPRIRPILEKIKKLPNAAVRYSSDTFDRFTPGLHGSVVLVNKTPANVWVCPAYERVPASCNSCRACWDKNVPVVGYKVHGANLKRVAAQASASAY